MPNIITSAQLFAVSWVHKTDQGFIWGKNVNTDMKA